MPSRPSNRKAKRGLACGLVRCNFDRSMSATSAQWPSHVHTNQPPITRHHHTNTTITVPAPWPSSSARSPTHSGARTPPSSACAPPRPARRVVGSKARVSRGRVYKALDNVRGPTSPHTMRPIHRPTDRHTHTRTNLVLGRRRREGRRARRRRHLLHRDCERGRLRVVVAVRDGGGRGGRGGHGRRELAGALFVWGV